MKRLPASRTPALAPVSAPSALSGRERPGAITASFCIGLLAVAWVASGYLPGSPLALALVLLIAAVYVAGALELRRFEQASSALARLLAATTEPPPELGPWLARLPAGLQQAVRLRIEGERVALPGPALAPYLAGLLVLLGMLGTFLGMIVTLKGTGLALENAGDVDAIRASLAAPVKGLGLAFGTSVAGVAASAALGLMTALARRRRRLLALELDALGTTVLGGWSRAHQRAALEQEREAQARRSAERAEAQRDETLRLLRLQAEAMPALVAQLQALVTEVGQQGRSLHDNLLANQSRFQGEAARAYAGLAESVARSLEAALAESARLAAAAIEPAVRTTMAGLEREAATLREALGGAVQRQIDAVATRLEATTEALAASWQAAAAEQQQRGETLNQGLQAGFKRFADTFEQRSASLLDRVAAKSASSAAQAADAWSQALAAQQQGQQQLLHDTQQALASTLAGFDQQGAALLRAVAESQQSLEAGAAARDAQRLAAFEAGLAALATRQQQQGEEAGRAGAAQQQQICAALERSAEAITARSEAQARATIAEIDKLVAAASQAPQAAADLVAELRRAHSESLVHDNAVLEERSRLLATLAGLLDAVNHASREQRAAIEALVQSGADLLERSGRQFAATVDSESRALQSAAAQLGAGAAEIASLGEGFGAAVQQFGQASAQMMAQLGRIENALGHSLARSDEQLAYYVAQAREIIDLTLGSHRQIVEDLQQLTRSGAAAEAAAA